MKEPKRRDHARRTAADSKARSLSGGPAHILRADLPLPTIKTAFFGRGAVWVCILLILANLVTYAPVRHFDFVTWDDPLYLVSNPHVVNGLTRAAVWWAFSSGYLYYWHPLTWLSHMLDVQLYGLNPGPHHITNVLIHVTSTILLFGVLYIMTGALGRSGFVAGLFAIHPLHVESVAWVAERKDVLSTLFWTLTIWAYIWYVRQARLGRYLLVLLVFALALMSKPMVVTLPLVLLLLDIWPLRRINVGLALSHGAWFRLVMEKVPLVVLAIGSSVLTFVTQHEVGAVAGLDTLPLGRRIANGLVSYAAYIGKMLWPTRLAAFYPYPASIPEWWVAASVLGLIAVSLIVFRMRRRKPYLPVGWFWYLGTLLPVIGLVQAGRQSMADRFTYVPLIGLFVVVAWGAPELVSRWRSSGIALTAVAAIVLCACAVTARAQAQHWQNSFALWKQAAEVTKDNPIAHDNLGLALAEQGRFSEAIAQYSEALRIDPNFPEAHNDLAVSLEGQGKTEEAMRELLEALRIKPGFALTHNNLGNALMNEGRTSEAMSHYAEALRIKPDYAEAHEGLGVAMAGRGQINEAIAHYSEALRIKADFAKAHNDLANALGSLGRAKEAAAHYSEALRIKPGYAEAHNNFGVALANLGRTSEAIAHYSEALRIKPEYAIAHNNLAIAFANDGKVNEAIREFSEALRINPNNLAARQALEELNSQTAAAKAESH